MSNCLKTKYFVLLYFMSGRYFDFMSWYSSGSLPIILSWLSQSLPEILCLYWGFMTWSTSYLAWECTAVRWRVSLKTARSHPWYLERLQRPASQAHEHQYKLFPWTHQPTSSAKISWHITQHWAFHGAWLGYSSAITLYGILCLANATLDLHGQNFRGGLEYGALG